MSDDESSSYRHHKDDCSCKKQKSCRKSSRTSDRHERHERCDRSERHERCDRSERSERHERHERCCKCEKGDKGDKGDKGERGPHGPEGPKGPQGEKGEKGEKGCEGPKGPQGEKGEKGEKGCEGPRGLPCKPRCAKACIEFSEGCIQGCDAHKIYKVANLFVVIVYGFAEGRPKSFRICKNGLEVETCAKQFIQIDLSDYNRVKSLECPDPKIKFSPIQKYENIVIYGSNKLGELGKQLYSYTSESDSCTSKEITIPSFDTTNLTRSGDLYLYGPNAFKYISITGCNQSIFINSLLFAFSKCDA